MFFDENNIDFLWETEEKYIMRKILFCNLELLVKGFEGYVVGIIVRKNTNLVKNILATLLGVLIMVSGYLLAGTFLQGSFIISLGSVPSNTIQGIVSMVIGIPIASYLLTVKYVKSFKQISSN